MKTQRYGKISGRALAVPSVFFGLAYMFIKPIFDSANWQANHSLCQNNLKHIGVALRMYAKDADSTLPPVFSSSDKIGWARVIQPYVKLDDDNPSRPRWVYECPADATSRNEMPAAKGFSDYWYNANVMQRTPRGIRPLRLTNLSLPVQTILAGCGGSSAKSAGFDATFNQCGDGTSLSGPNQTCVISPIGSPTIPGSPAHVNYDTNVLYADGHVKSGKADRFLNNGATLSSVGGKGTFAVLIK